MYSAPSSLIMHAEDLTVENWRINEKLRYLIGNVKTLKLLVLVSTF